MHQALVKYAAGQPLRKLHFALPLILTLITAFSISAIAQANSIVFHHEIEANAKIKRQLINGRFAKNLSQSIRDMHVQYPDDEVQLTFEGPGYDFTVELRFRGSATDEKKLQAEMLVYERSKKKSQAEEFGCTKKVMQIMPRSRHPHCYKNIKYYRQTRSQFRQTDSDRLARAVQAEIRKRMKRR